MKAVACVVQSTALLERLFFTAMQARTVISCFRLALDGNPLIAAKSGKEKL